MTTPEAQGDGYRVPDVAASIIRTLVPAAVSAVLSWVAASQHIVLGHDASASAGAWAMLVVFSGYYAAARWLERRQGTGWPNAARWLGRWMLGGVIRQPVYVEPPPNLARVIDAAGYRKPE